MNGTTKNAVYMRSEWVDAPTGAPLEEFLTTAEIGEILNVLALELRHIGCEESLPHLRSGYEKLAHFSERYELGDD
jgi:hypothetical protein